MIDFAEYKAVYRYNINGNVATRYYVGTLEFVKEPGDTGARLARANLPLGFLDAGGTAIQTTDYYPYGLPMATSTGAAANRYKYRAKEFETRNGLNFHNFEARMLFNDITLFSRPDPHAGKYPHLNPYLYCAANPIMFVDPSGKELHYLDDDQEYVYQTVDNQIAVYDMRGNDVDQSSLSIMQQSTIECLNEYLGTKVGTQLVSNIISSDKTVTMTFDSTKSNYLDSDTGILYFNPNKSESGLSFNELTGSYSRSGSATINLSHEMGHAEDWINGTIDNRIWGNLGNSGIAAKSEIHACWRENQFRAEIDFPQRISYASKQIGSGYVPVLSTILVTNKGLFMFNKLP